MPVLAKLGKYEIRATLGEGAAGTVYEAWDPVIERSVAIKTLKPTDEEESHTRFLREAQAVGRLVHPNIVFILDFGVERHNAYIVMELVEGRSLKERLDRKEPFAPAEIASIMQELLAGLQYSHDKGVVHRDIKPANVLLTGDGHVKLADFGIARLEGSSLTQTGVVMGTPAYMSPEQIGGERLLPATDIWSAGVVLYQMLTGERPFEGGDMSVAQKILLTEPIPPSRIRVTLPRSFDGVLRKALAKRPAERFASAAAFARAVREAAAAPGPADESPTVVVPRKEPPPRSTRLPIVGALTVGVLLLGAGAWGLWGGGNGPLSPHVAPLSPDPQPPASAIEAWQPLPSHVAPLSPDPQPPASAIEAWLTKPVPLLPPPPSRPSVREPEMVRIPAGSFTIGTSDEEDQREGVRAERAKLSKPRSTVTVAAFELAQNTVTRGEFAAFVRANPNKRPASGCVNHQQADLLWSHKFDPKADWEHPGFPGFEQTDDHPVVCVSHDDAIAYVTWLNTQVEGRPYRLPTEVEWEYAARGRANQGKARFWGDGREQACTYANVADKKLVDVVSASDDPKRSFPCSDGYAFTAPVRHFRPNDYGLYDMLGNVWQWTSSCWHENYDDLRNNGTFGSSGICRLRALRGGSWYYGPWIIRSGSRIENGSEARVIDTGFRLARAL